VTASSVLLNPLVAKLDTGNPVGSAPHISWGYMQGLVATVYSAKFLLLIDGDSHTGLGEEAYCRTFYLYILPLCSCLPIHSFNHPGRGPQE
jgi:hypothetical protein